MKKERVNDEKKGFIHYELNKRRKATKVIVKYSNVCIFLLQTVGFPRLGVSGDLLQTDNREVVFVIADMRCKCGMP